MRPANRPLVDRAPRYPLALPARVRPAGATSWTQTTTIDVSRSGVLLLADGAEFELADCVDLELELSKGSIRGAEIACTGRVVRRTRTNGRAAIAVAMDLFDSSSAPEADLQGA